LQEPANGEIYLLENAGEFRRALESKEKDLFLIPLINYYGAFPPDPNRAYLFASHRLFRNHKGFKFIGNIHEHLNVQILQNSCIPETIPYVKIHHYGYMDSVAECRKKYERNLYMLEEERSCPAYSPWIMLPNCEVASCGRIPSIVQITNKIIMENIVEEGILSALTSSPLGSGFK